MIGPAIILAFCVASSAFTNVLAVSPDDLQKLIQQVDSQVKSEQHEAEIEISDLLQTTIQAASQAKSDFNKNLTRGSQYFWGALYELELELFYAGVDYDAVTKCRNPVVAKVYLLNETVINAAYEEITSYQQKSEEIASNSSATANSVLDKLSDLEKKANDCSNDTCATELYSEAENYLQEAELTIKTAVETMQNYANVDFQRDLNSVSFDGDGYHLKVKALFDEFKTCVDNI